MQVLFILSLIGFSLGNLARIQFTNGVAVTLLDMAVACMVFWWILTKVRRRERLKGALLKPIMIFILVCIISLAANMTLLTSPQLFIAFLYLVRWVGYVAIYFIVSEQDGEVRKKIPKLLIVAGIVHVTIGFMQYFFIPDLDILFHLGWDEHLYRMFGSLLDPNYLGAVLSLFLCLLINKFDVNKKHLKTRKGIGMALLLVVTLIAIVLTYSRSALIMVFTSVIAFAILKSNKRVAAIIIGAMLVFVIIFSNVAIEGLNPFRSVSTNARLISLNEALHIIERNPVFGVGYNAYRYAQQRYGLRSENTPIVSHADAGTDNSYLFVLATTGFLGFVSYIYLLWSLMALSKSRKSFIATTTIISLIGILINSLFINSLFYPFIMYWLWIIAGLTERS